MTRAGFAPRWRWSGFALLRALLLTCALAVFPLGPSSGQQSSDPSALLSAEGQAAIEAATAFVQQLSSRLEAAPAEAREGLRSELGRAHGELGRLYMSYQLADEAAVAFSKARELAPADVRWSYYLGLLSIEAQEFDQAVSWLEQVVAAHPDDIGARLRLGGALLELERTDDARTQFERALAIDPESAAAKVGLARIDLETEPARAATALEEAIEQQPQAKRLHYFAAQAYRRLGNEELARSHATRYGSGDVAFPEPLLQSLVEAGQDAGFFVATGDRAAAAGRHEYAESSYRRALELAPGEPRALEGLGNALEQRGLLSEALRAFEQALEGDENNARLHGHLGRVLAALGRLDDARARLETARRLDPQDLPATLLLAGLEARQERYEEALQLYDAVLEWDPQNTGALLGRPQALLALGQTENALVEIRRLIKAWPERHGVRINLATLLARGGDPQGATAELEALFEEEGVSRESLALAHYNLGIFALRDGRLDAARSRLEQAVRADDELVEAHFQLGVLIARSDVAGATPHLTRVVELDAGHVPARLALTTALALQEQCDRAREVIESGVRSRPDDPNLVHTLARLLLTCPTMTDPDPQLALELSKRAFDRASTLEIGETLGMAYASTGAFDQAARWQQALVDESVRLGDADWEERLRANLARYLEQESPLP